MINFCFTDVNKSTNIIGRVQAKYSQPTWSLEGSTLAVILKNEKNQEMHQLRLSIDQVSFPLTFKISLTDKIQDDAFFLVSLLIFGLSHRLLWECVSFPQQIMVHQVNNINFTVMDVCE